MTQPSAALDESGIGDRCVSRLALAPFRLAPRPRGGSGAVVTFADAQLIARRYVESMQGEAGIDLVVLDELTLEKEFGWVFFYDSKRHVETKDCRDSIAGNAPIVVARNDGSVHVTGTAHPVEHYLGKLAVKLRNSVSDG